MSRQSDLAEKLKAASEETATEAELRKEIASLKRQVAKVQRNEDAILAVVRQAIEDGWSVAPPKRRPADRRKRRRRETHVLMIGDTQIGKTTPTYDVAVARERVLETVERADSIVATRREAAVCDDVVIALMGDMVEGENIFPGQPWEIQTGVYEQACKWAPEIMASSIRAACEVWPNARVRAVCGNHGRNDFASHPKTNWDRVSYEVTRLLLRGVVDDFKVAESFCIVERLPGGWGLMLTHGDSLQGKGTSGVFETAVKDWASVLEDDDGNFTYCGIGHFHRAAMYPVHKRHLIINGSTESPDSAYVRAKIKASGYPSQTLLAFDEEHGLIGHHLLYLGKRVPR